MKNLVKLLFLCIFIGQYSFGVEWHDFFEENGSLIYQLRYYSKLFKKDQENAEPIIEKNNDNNDNQIKQELDEELIEKIELEKQNNENENVVKKWVKEPIFWIVVVGVVIVVGSVFAGDYLQGQEKYAQWYNNIVKQGDRPKNYHDYKGEPWWFLRENPRKK